MEQLPLPSVDVTVNVEAFFGLTTWKRACDEPPPCTGWWKTRRRSSPGMLQPQRRWWDTKTFSYPVVVGEDSDEAAEEIAVAPTHIDLDDIEWCGLQLPHPSGLPYKPVKTA